MKSDGCGYGLRAGSGWNFSTQITSAYWIGGLALALTACATHRDSAVGRSEIPGLAEPRVCPFGRVALAGDLSPASFSFQKAKGKLGSAKQAIVDSAAMGLSGPGAGVIAGGTVLSEFGGGDAYSTAAVAGAAGGVVALGAVLYGPVVGARGLIRSLEKVRPEELAKCEAALTNALCQMAQQQPFRNALLRAGSESIRGGFASSGPGDDSQITATKAADAIIRARVDDLRLERAGSGEGSYYLRIMTHAQVVRVADGTVCLEEHAEYRSGTALFLEWTLEGAVQGVAETGYTELARYYVRQILANGY